MFGKPSAWTVQRHSRHSRHSRILARMSKRTPESKRIETKRSARSALRFLAARIHSPRMNSFSAGARKKNQTKKYIYIPFIDNF